LIPIFLLDIFPCKVEPNTGFTFLYCAFEYQERWIHY